MIKKHVENNKKAARLRRSKRTRMKIRELDVPRLSVCRSNNNVYAQITTSGGDKVLVQASTLEAEIRAVIKHGGNKEAAALVGKLVAERAVKAGISTVAFDRSGYKYHGCVKALADAARDNGVQF